MDLEGSGNSLIEVISRELSDGSEEIHQHTLVKTFGDPAEIRNGYPLLTSSYLSISLLCRMFGGMVMNYEFGRM